MVLELFHISSAVNRNLRFHGSFMIFPGCVRILPDCLKALVSSRGCLIMVSSDRPAGTLTKGLSRLWEIHTMKPINHTAGNSGVSKQKGCVLCYPGFSEIKPKKLAEMMAYDTAATYMRDVCRDEGGPVRISFNRIEL